MKSACALSGTLDTRIIKKAPAPHKARSIRIPGFGRLLFTTDPGQSSIVGRESMQSNLSARIFDGDGRFKGAHDLGSGLVQQNLVVGLAQDQLGTTANKAAPLLANSGKYMYSGTGGTANAYDYQLATTAGPASGSVTPTLAFSADNATLTYVGTIAYTTTLAITEWGLFNTNSQGGANTTAANAFTSTTYTPTVSPAWTVNAEAGFIIVVGTVGGFIVSNTATAATIGTGWYNLTSGGGAASTPSANTSASVFPLMSDHKTFSALNVVNGDSIQFTYVLTLTSGG